MTWKRVATVLVLARLPLVVAFVEFQSASAATAASAKISPIKKNPRAAGE